MSHRVKVELKSLLDLHLQYDQDSIYFPVYLCPVMLQFAGLNTEFMAGCLEHVCLLLDN